MFLLNIFLRCQLRPADLGPKGFSFQTLRAVFESIIEFTLDLKL